MTKGFGKDNLNKSAIYMGGNIQTLFGVIGNNKGVDIINNQIELPDFTDKDLKALNIAKSLGINEIFISFCKSTDSIDLVKSINKNSSCSNCFNFGKSSCSNPEEASSSMLCFDWKVV